MLQEIKKTLWLFAGIALLAQISWAGVNVPDWVRQAASQTLPKYEPDTNAVVLLDQTDFTVTAPGEYIEHSRHVVKILRHEGRDEGFLAMDAILEVFQWDRPNGVV